MYTDLILADFLVSCTPFVDTVVFQCVSMTSYTDASPKMIPWFVSDVLPGDFEYVDAVSGLPR